MPRDLLSWSNRLNGTAQNAYQIANKYATDTRNWLNSQTLLKRVFIYVVSAMMMIAGLLVLIFHAKIIEFLVSISTKWHDSRFGILIMCILLFGVAFPPLFGYSALSTMTGMIWGFPNGWVILALGTICGSVSSFVFFRYTVLSKSIQTLNKNKKFVMMREIMREDKRLMLLILIRLCPLPYSLSNAAFAAIPDITLTKFFLAGVITSPKLLIPIYVGSKLKEIGDTKSKSTKFIDIVSILIAGCAASATAYIIYYKMQQKIQQRSYQRVPTEDNGDPIDDPELITLNSNFDNDPNSINFDNDFENFVVEDEDEFGDENNIGHDDLGLDFDQVNGINRV